MALAGLTELSSMSSSFIWKNNEGLFPWQLGRIHRERVKVSKNWHNGLSTASCWPKQVTGPAQRQAWEKRSRLLIGRPAESHCKGMDTSRCTDCDQFCNCSTTSLTCLLETIEINVCTTICRLQRPFACNHWILQWDYELSIFEPLVGHRYCLRHVLLLKLFLTFPTHTDC